MDPVTFEEALERNPLRKTVRRYFEVKPLRAAAGKCRIDRALHFCCRDGQGTALLHRYFSPSTIAAVDPDEGLLAAARGCTAGLPVELSCGPLTGLDFPDASFDAVFVLGELHNYPAWRECVDEIARVTAPGGLFILEDLSAESFEYALGRYFRARTDHHYGAMLRLDEFRDYVLGSGYEILRLKKFVPFGLFKYFVLVARKKA